MARMFRDLAMKIDKKGFKTASRLKGQKQCYVLQCSAEEFKM